MPLGRGPASPRGLPGACVFGNAGGRKGGESEKGIASPHSLR